MVTYAMRVTVASRCDRRYLAAASTGLQRLLVSLRSDFGAVASQW